MREDTPASVAEPGSIGECGGEDMRRINHGNYGGHMDAHGLKESNVIKNAFETKITCT